MNKELIIKKLQELISILKEEEPANTQPLSQERPEEWPKAIPGFKNDEQYKQEKAYKEALWYNIQNTDEVLDFGAGEGFLSAAIGSLSKKSVAFDLRPDRIRAAGHYTVIKDYEALKDSGPYDIIILNDVLDHLEATVPDDKGLYIENLIVRTLIDLKPLLKKGDGRFKIKTHPWTCRHGGHLYNSQNMAFVHLILSDEEYLQQSVTSDAFTTHEIYNGPDFYKRCFVKANCEIISEQRETDSVEAFIKNRLFKNITKKFYEPPSDKELEALMEISYIKYVLNPL